MLVVVEARIDARYGSWRLDSSTSFVLLMTIRVSLPRDELSSLKSISP